MEKPLIVFTRKRGRAASIALSLVAILLFSASACAPRHAPSVTEAALRYKPVTIASGVPASPGSLAWSPDGAHLAFIGKSLKVYDSGSGKLTSFPIDDPYYVAWASDNTLYALSRDLKGNSVLCSLDLKSSRITTLALDLNANALYPASDGKKLLIVSINIKTLNIGTRISCTISMHNMASGSSKTVYNFDKTYMIKGPYKALLTAWTHAGPSALDNALLVMEHIKPPLLAFYTTVNTLDLATGEISELSNPGAKKTYLSASWSPDGKRAVMTDSDGRLEVRDRQGKGVVIDPARTGIYPSWSLRGSRIFAGGYLIDSDGKNKETLLVDAAESIAQWSSDGTTLAVATGDDLLLFRNIRPTYVRPDRPLDKTLSEKFSLLKELLAEGVISPDEYHERHAAIFMKSEEVK